MVRTVPSANDAGDFITFMDDGDILLDSFVFGPKNIRELQGIRCWWRGTGTGDDKGSLSDTMWTVQGKANNAQPAKSFRPGEVAK